MAEDTIAEAYRLLRAGDFDKSLQMCRHLLAEDTKNFWASYLACVALGYLQNDEEFSRQLGHLRGLKNDSPYLNYLLAYEQLKYNDIEKALWLWAEIADSREGWLATELVELARTGKDLAQLAQERISDFVILPEFLADLFHPEEPRKPEEVEPAPVGKVDATPVKEGGTSKAVYVLLSSAFLIAAIALAIWRWPTEQTRSTADYKRLTIHEYAHVLSGRKEKSLFSYSDRKQLIGDFNQAKQELHRGKVNQARFLLNRIVQSNADFKSKEKSKVFLRFIPIPTYEDFKDSLEVSAVLLQPAFYRDCLVLWQGKINNLKTVDKGISLSLLIEEAEKSYLVEGFMVTQKPEQKIADLQSLKADKPDKAVIYGVFKGLVGDQRRPYVELIKLWR